MSMKTQGTQLFFIDPSNDSVMTVGCPTSIDGIDTTNEQIETTCLNSQARTYEGGLATPGAASVGINFDTADVSHMRMHQLKVAKTTLKWAVGLADGTDLPTVDTNGDFNLPSSRSWISFVGYMNSYPWSIALNAVVASTIGIQISGEPEVIEKAA